MKVLHLEIAITGPLYRKPNVPWSKRYPKKNHECQLWYEFVSFFPAMWTFVNLLGPLCELSKDWLHSEMKTRLLLLIRALLSSLSARLITSHHIIPCWSVGPALENYWWEQSHERRLLTSLMCCSWYTTPHSSTGLTAVRYDDGVDRRGWENLAVINLLGWFRGICCWAC